MFVDKYSRKDGSVVYRITYTDDSGKRKRLPAEKTPKFKTLEEAQAWCKTQEAYLSAKRAKLEAKNAWRKQYYDFQELEKSFLEWHKKRAPNSWKNAKIYLTYIFDFFLNHKQCGNVNLWNLFHQEWRDWLEKEAKGTTANTKTENISYSTANHCINTLNNFQEYLVAYNKMDPEAKLKCDTFPQHLIGKRTWEDVITPEEYAAVHKALCEVDQDVADFFCMMYWTGMRFGEGNGLPMAYLYSGVVEGPIGKELEKHGLKNYGYIVLESQLAKYAKTRDKDGNLERKPLKTKRKISPENARTIPILDKECWNILARRYKVQKALHDNLRYGSKKENYLLFDDSISFNRLTDTLREVYEKLKIRPKSYHCCRHSRATYLVGETRSYFLAKAMLGHKSDVFDDYVHIYEMMALKAKQNSQDIEEIA